MKRRILNGYVAIYKPEHPSAYQSDNWKGYVYEHRYVAESQLGRLLHDDEVVHHLDCDRQNNSPNNLIVLIDHSSHAKIHNWIDSGMPIHESYTSKRTNNHYTVYTKCRNSKCNNTTHSSKNEYCSIVCANNATRKVKDMPSENELLRLLKYNSYSEIGRMYDVSDNAVRKWIKKYGHDPKTIKSQLKEQSC